MKHSEKDSLDKNLEYLKLQYMKQHYESIAATAAQKGWSHVHYLAEMAKAESLLRFDRAIHRRIQLARFPQIKTLEQFSWNWPTNINRMQIQNLFRLTFIQKKTNVIFLGTTGLGKTHLATALGYQACLNGYPVLFTSAVDAVNNLIAAQNTGSLKHELKKYHKPALLILDELGYLPIDKAGADLLFQIVSKRYEQGSLIITSNRAFKDWPEIFNNDCTLTSALLDRLLHHTETILIEGKSYRMKDTNEI
jgi:DNA replication protein DnaC